MTETNDVESVPIVLEREGEGRKYSRGLKQVQVSERQVTRAVHRVASSLEKGVSTYLDAQDESAAQKTDGAIRDFVPNVAEGVSAIMEELSGLPRDIARILYPERLEEVVRDTSKMVGRVMDFGSSSEDGEDSDEA